jgi:hypothetical protein
MLKGAVGAWFDDGPIVCGGLIQSLYKHTDQCFVFDKDNQWTRFEFLDPIFNPMFNPIYVAKRCKVCKTIGYRLQFQIHVEAA